MILRNGKLYWYEIDVRNIGDFFLVRLFRKFGIDYIPRIVKKCSRVYLSEDLSKYSRKLVNYCRKHGVITIVIEEGARYGKNPFGHSCLQADFFSCYEGNYNFWKDYIPAGRLLKHKYSKPKELYKGIVFLLPIYLKQDFTHPWFMSGHNTTVINVIETFYDEDVVFKPHPKNREFVEKLIPKNRLVWGEAVDLIKKYEKVYCFDKCSIKNDCKLLGVNPIIIEGENETSI